ncbi:MAG: hypothetical protein K9M45_07810 [Kiritimatiellales bacterium]|nr:hypothetical protein [Kiritimatiellales bacterium]
MSAGIGTLVEAVVTATPDQQKQIEAILNGRQKKRKLITTKAACALLEKCHPITLRRYEKRGLLHAVRFSQRRVRWDEDEVLALANNGITIESGAAA